MEEVKISKLDPTSRHFSWLLVGRNVIFRRLTVAVSELLAEALLVSVFFIWMAAEITKGQPPSNYHESAAFQIFVFTFYTLMMFTMTGYSITTTVVRCLWNGKSIWSYPILAVVLFTVHFELLSHSIGGAFDLKYRNIFRVFGAAITVLCTMFGSHLLKKYRALSVTTIEV